MNTTDDRNENELRGQVHALGRDTEHQAPAFQRVWRNAQRALAQSGETRRSSPLRWTLATAAAAAAICLAAMQWMNPPSQKARASTMQVASNPVVELAAVDTPDAVAPTDFLLTAANDSRAPSVERLTREIDALLKP